MAWHQWIETYEDDDGECGEECGSCGVVVETDAMGVFTVPCPAPPCDDELNRDRTCVFSTTGDRPACVFCGRPAAHRTALPARVPDTPAVAVA